MEQNIISEKSLSKNTTEFTFEEKKWGRVDANGTLWILGSSIYYSFYFSAVGTRFHLPLGLVCVVVDRNSF